MRTEFVCGEMRLNEGIGVVGYRERPGGQESANIPPHALAFSSPMLQGATAMAPAPKTAHASATQVCCSQPAYPDCWPLHTDWHVLGRRRLGSWHAASGRLHHILLHMCLVHAGYKLGPSGCELDCSCVDGAACIGPGECGCAGGCLYGTCTQGRCSCWAGYTGTNCNQTAPAPNANSPAGLVGCLWRAYCCHSARQALHTRHGMHKDLSSTFLPHTNLLPCNSLRTWRG